MGMENDNHQVLTFAEMQEIERQEKLRAEEEAKRTDPNYRALCNFINRKGEEKLLLISGNREFFTMNLKRRYKIDPRNNSPEYTDWDMNPVPMSKNDQVDFFGK